MSKGDLSLKGTPWLGSLCRKMEKMYEDVDQMMTQDTVGYAKSQIKTVGENVRKFGSNVMYDLPLPDFLASKANSASSLGSIRKIKPKKNSKVIAIECHTDNIAEKSAVRELENSSPEGVSSASTDVVSILKDDHWPKENLERKVGKLSPSEGVSSASTDLVSILKDDHWPNKNLERNVVDDLEVGKLSPSEGVSSASTDLVSILKDGHWPNENLERNVLNDLKVGKFSPSEGVSSASADLISILEDDHWPNDSLERNVVDYLKVGKFSPSEGVSSASTELMSILKDDHWPNESLERNVVDDVKEGKLSPSEAPELTRSEGDDPSESCPEKSSTNMVQEAEDDVKEKVPSSSEGSESVRAIIQDIVESLSKSASIDKADQDANNLFRRIPLLSTTDCPLTTDCPPTSDCPSTTDRPPTSDCPSPTDCPSATDCPSTTDGSWSGLPQRAGVAGPVQEYDSDIASGIFCSEQVFPVGSYESESNSGAIPLRNSLLSESLDLVEVFLPDLPRKEGKTCEEDVDSNRLDISHSSTTTLAWDFAGQSSASIVSIKDKLMETIDLSDKVELDQSCVMVEKDANLSFSSRRGCFNKYKAKLKNSFGSKKRLEKDYKLLAIRHGDIDTDFRHLTRRNKTVAPTVRDDLKISPAQDVEDAEWEII